MKPRIKWVDRGGLNWECYSGIDHGIGKTPMEAYERYLLAKKNRCCADAYHYAAQNKRFNVHENFVMPSGGYNVSCVGGGGHQMDGATEVDKKSAWAALKGIFLL